MYSVCGGMHAQSSAFSVNYREVRKYQEPETRNNKWRDTILGKILWAFGIKMCLTSVVCWTVFIVPDQTAGMLRGRGLVVLVWLVPCVGPLVTRVHLAVGTVALRRNLAQRHHLQPVLLARRHAMH